MDTSMCMCVDVWGDGEEWEGKTATGGIITSVGAQRSPIIPAPYYSPLKTAHADPCIETT
jgi:hypothetical protein